MPLHALLSMILYYCLLTGNIDACNGGGTKTLKTAIKAAKAIVDESDKKTYEGDYEKGGFRLIDLHLHSKVLAILIGILMFLVLTGCLLYVCRSYCCKLKCFQSVKQDRYQGTQLRDRDDPIVRFSDVARLQHELNMPYNRPLLQHQMMQDDRNFARNQLMIPPRPFYDEPRIYEVPSTYQRPAIAAPPSARAPDDRIYVAINELQPRSQMDREPTYAHIVHRPTPNEAGDPTPDPVSSKLRAAAPDAAQATSNEITPVSPTPEPPAKKSIIGKRRVTIPPAKSGEKESSL